MSVFFFWTVLGWLRPSVNFSFLLLGFLVFVEVTHNADGGVFQINRPHLAYTILGGFTSIFMLCSLFIKEKLYIGEASKLTVPGNVRDWF